MSQTLVIPKRCRESERAFVMINCEDGSESCIIDQIRPIDGVVEVASTLGPYDIIVRLEVQSTETLREVISSRIRTIPQVRSTTTIVCGPLIVFR